MKATRASWQTPRRLCAGYQRPPLAETTWPLTAKLFPHSELNANVHSYIAKVLISPITFRAFKQERRTSARRGSRKRVCAGDCAHTRTHLSRGRARAATSARRGPGSVSATAIPGTNGQTGVQISRHGIVSATAIPPICRRLPLVGWRTSLQSRQRTPRGAYAPRSWLYMRSCLAKVAILPTNVRAFEQARRRQPAVARKACLRGRLRAHSHTIVARKSKSRDVSPPWRGNAFARLVSEVFLSPGVCVSPSIEARQSLAPGMPSTAGVLLAGRVNYVLTCSLFSPLRF